MTPRTAILLLLAINLSLTIFFQPLTGLGALGKGILWGLQFGLMLYPFLNVTICDEEEKGL